MTYVCSLYAFSDWSSDQQSNWLISFAGHVLAPSRDISREFSHEYAAPPFEVSFMIVMGRSIHS